VDARHVFLIHVRAMFSSPKVFQGTALRRSGTGMFRARKKLVEDEEAGEHVFVNGAQKLVARTPTIPVVRIAAGKWWIHGMYEEQVIKDGLRRLDTAWEERGLFSKREACVSSDRLPRLVCEGLLADLVAGERSLSDVHKTDVAMAQGDLTHLTMRQLLRLRVNNLDYAPQGDDNASMHAFLAKTDKLLFEHLGQQAVGNLLPHLSPQSLFRLGVDLALVTAVAASLVAPSWWVCWVGHGAEARRFFLHPATFSSTFCFPSSQESTCGVFEIADNSKVCHHSRGKHRVIDWKVSAHVEQRTLCRHRVVAERGGNAPAQAAGGVAVGPREEFILHQAIAGLKKIGSRLW